jgi:hypothetical protein
MDNTVISFDEAMTQIGDGEKPSILLGNGFSLALRNDIFNYANLLEKADFGDRDPELRRLFKVSETYDFEAVMRSLIAAKAVLEAYGGNKTLVETIEQDVRRLKDALITAISATHPGRPADVSDVEFTAVRHFLSRFDHVFTVNYDLLFYWARNQNNLPPQNYRSDDGFRTRCIWKPDNPEPQKAHFLHGALHIFDSEAAIEKHAANNIGTGIIDLVRANLDVGKFPLFVAEPTSAKKKHRIEHNPYLAYCFRALQKNSGAFFIIGHSMDENDKHIFDELKQSKVNRFFVSIFGDEDNDANARVKANAIAYLKSGASQVTFFDAQSAPIWRSNCVDPSVIGAL